MEELDLAFLESEAKMDKVLAHYNENLSRIAVGRANPQLLNTIKVSYYGELMPLTELANISVPDPRQLLIKPYQPEIVKPIAQSLNASSLKLAFADEGDKIRITFPEVTTERRRELVKMFGSYTEQSRVGIRSLRHELIKTIKHFKLPEDEEKRQVDAAQKLTDSYVAKITTRSLEKKDELMKM